MERFQKLRVLTVAFEDEYPKVDKAVGPDGYLPFIIDVKISHDDAEAAAAQ